MGNYKDKGTNTPNIEDDVSEKNDRIQESGKYKKLMYLYVQCIGYVIQIRIIIFQILVIMFTYLVARDPSRSVTLQLFIDFSIADIFVVCS